MARQQNPQQGYSSMRILRYLLDQSRTGRLVAVREEQEETPRVRAAPRPCPLGAAAAFKARLVLLEAAAHD